MAHDVFICYAKQDEPLAAAVAAGLEQQGLTCWYLARDMTGLDVNEATIAALRTARAVVLALTSHSATSPFNAKDIERAHKLDKPVYVYDTDGSAPSEALAAGLGNAPKVAATTPAAEGLHTLAEKLLQFIPLVTETAAAPMAAAPPRRGGVIMALLFGAVLVAGAASYIEMNRGGAKRPGAELAPVVSNSPPLHRVAAPTHDADTTQTIVSATPTPRRTPAPTATPQTTPQPSATPAMGMQPGQDEEQPGMAQGGQNLPLLIPLLQDAAQGDTNGDDNANGDGNDNAPDNGAADNGGADGGAGNN